MRVRPIQFSLRSLLCLVVVVACIVAFFCTFGTHLLWIPDHITSSHVSLIELEPPTREPEDPCVRCQFGGIRFLLPELMTNQISVGRSGSDVWIKFVDANRQVGVLWPKCKDSNRDPLRQTFLPLHNEMADWSSPRLMKEICDCSSDGFTWKQSKKDLRTHQWAITQRRKQGLDVNNFAYYSFEAGDACEWILLSCYPATVDRKERLRSVMIWETENRESYGRVHFGDAARQEVVWIRFLAHSFEVAPSSTDLQAIDVANMTDSEILSMVVMDYGSGEND